MTWSQCLRAAYPDSLEALTPSAARAVIMPPPSSASLRRHRRSPGCLDNCGHFVAGERPAAKECGGQVEDSSPVVRISDQFACPLFQIANQCIALCECP